VLLLVPMFPNFDPSKMDPKVLMELSQLIQQLPHEKLMRMQTLMHNMMAGFDVRKEMEEFEKSLPPGFRERLMELMAKQAASNPAVFTSAATAAPAASVPGAPVAASADGAPMDVRSARLTVLRAVADGQMTPEQAEPILFPEG
jgi:hypothetical protein